MSHDIIQELLRFAIAERDAFYDCSTNAEGNLTDPGDQAELDRMDAMIDRAQAALADPPSVAVPEDEDTANLLEQARRLQEAQYGPSAQTLTAAPAPDHSGEGNEAAFSDTAQEIEDRQAYLAENSCPHCGGSGHKDDIADAGKVVTSSWKSAKNGQHWPHIGGKYLIKLNGVLQHEIYEFDQGDDGMGGGDYFWDREDPDEAAPFNPEKDEWLPIDEVGSANPSVPENELPRRDWAAIAKFVDEWAGDYEFETGGEGVYQPSEQERLLIVDAMHGLLDQKEFQRLIAPELFSPPVPPLVPESEVKARALEERASELDDLASVFADRCMGNAGIVTRCRAGERRREAARLRRSVEHDEQDPEWLDIPSLLRRGED